MHIRPLRRQSSLTWSAQIITLSGIQLLFCHSISFITSSQTIRNGVSPKTVFKSKTKKDSSVKPTNFLTEMLFEMQICFHSFSLVDATLLKHLDFLRLWRCSKCNFVFKGSVTEPMCWKTKSFLDRDAVRGTILFSFFLSRWCDAAETLRVFATVRLFEVQFCFQSFCQRTKVLKN